VGRSGSRELEFGAVELEPEVSGSELELLAFVLVVLVAPEVTEAMSGVAEASLTIACVDAGEGKSSAVVNGCSLEVDGAGLS
jgi:hypothetical protein